MRQATDDGLDGMDEAHVQHLVRLVEHEHLDGVELQGIIFDQVHEAAGGGDEHVDAPLERPDLPTHGTPPMASVVERRMWRPNLSRLSRIWPESSRVGERISTRQERGSMRRGVAREVVKDGKAEGGGLAGARLGDADEILAGKDGRNGLCLDGRGRHVLFFGQRTDDGLGKAEFRK